MKGVLAAVGLLATLLPVEAQKGKPGRPPEVKVVEFSAHRQSGRILIDGRVLVTSERPLKGLVVLFDLMAPGRQVISTQKTVVAEDPVEKGREAEFHVHTVDHVRAVHVRVHCEDTDHKYLRVENEGPYPIE